MITTERRSPTWRANALKHSSSIILILLLGLTLAVWLNHRAPRPPQIGEKYVAPAMPPRSSPPGNSNSPPLLGEQILRGYASAQSTPEQDLTLMARLMDNSLLLLKSAANRPLSANEDWADLLRGRNAASERFLPDAHVALNAQGQLVDRWQTPLFFHAVGGGRYELRSAGPDQKLWTDDDIHRNPDGSFRRGSSLNPPALFPNAP